MAGLSAADMERLRLEAEAIMEKRKRSGEWTGVIQAHTAYQKKPLEWIVKYLGIPENTIRWSMNEGYENHDWDGDKDPLVTVLETLADGRDCGVESATGTGKTFLAGAVSLWFLSVFEGSLIVTVAPKGDQLFEQIWMEIGRLWNRFERHFPGAELLSGKIRMKPDEDDKDAWSAKAFICGVGASEESATKAQGFHRPHMLIITEETPGIHTAIMTALAHTRTDDHNLHLALGNPDHQNDSLHQFCIKESVVHVRISGLDHPNIVTGLPIVPGALGRRRLKERIEEYGVGSRLYNSRIRGISPKEAEDALIKWAWCEAAAKKYDLPEYRDGDMALGVDVANSETGDKGAIARWQGACCTEVEDFPCPDPNELGYRVAQEAMSEGIPGKHVGIDSVGVGAGTVNEAKRLGLKVAQISGGKVAIPWIDQDLKWSAQRLDDAGRIMPSGPTVVDAEQFDNLRSQVWWKMREDLRKGNIALPYDNELWKDLCTPTYSTPNGKIKVQSKEDIVKNLKRSPNKGDAAAYGNFVRPRAPSTRDVATRTEVTTTNRDYGLERFLATEAKKRRADQRRMARLFKSNSKRRRN